MKKLILFFKKKMQDAFTFWDIALLKTYGAIPGLILGAYFPDFIKDNLVLFIIPFMILWARYCYLLFIKKLPIKQNDPV